MARLARIVIPGVPHHITQRGNYQQDVFFTADDRRVYLRHLRESAQRHGLAIHAYCLMTNHVHLVATPKREESLAKALGRTHLLYAQHIHRIHERVGHFWQSRFYSCALDDGYAHNACIYVELNPVRARIVRMPWRYPWSSAAVHCGEGGDRSGCLDLTSWNEDMTPKKWTKTLANAAGDEDATESIRLHTRTGRPLGDGAFLNKVEAYLGRSVRAVPRGRPVGSMDSAPRKRRGGGGE